MPYFININFTLCRKALLFLLLLLFSNVPQILADNKEFDDYYQEAKNIISLSEGDGSVIDSLKLNGNAYLRGCLNLLWASEQYKDENYLVSDSLLNEARALFYSVNSSKGVGYCDFYKANSCIAQGVNDESVVYYQQALFNFKKCLYKDGIVLCCSRLASYFSQKKNVIKAHYYFDIGKDYVYNLKHEGIKKSFLLNNAAFYTEITEADSAILLYNLILRDFKGRLSQRNKAKIYNNLASNHVYLKQWQKAIDNYNKSLVIKEELGDSLGIIRTKQNVYRYYVDLRQMDEAKVLHLQLGQYFDNDTSDYDTYVDFLYNQVKYYAILNKGNDVTRLLREYNLAEKYRTNAAFSDKLIEMQKSFDLKEKDQEIALLHKEDALNQARLKTKNILIAVTGSFLLVLILVGYLINRQRKELAQSRRRLLRQKEDITGMNEQLRVSNLAKDRILSVIGHDLRGPVGGLKELIELYMELPEYEPNDIKNLLKAARESSTSTYHLLENLLSWANSQRGDIVFNPVATPLAPLIKQSVQLLDRSINVRNVRFEYDIPQALVIQVDMNMLRTIIRNLVSNALKYSPDNGLIKIMVIEDGKQVKFCICDQGKGMTADETKSIFKKKETYFIGSELTAKGTGLGLILCKEFVERHGGAIWINSEEGVGTQVWFSIPQKGVSTAKVGELQSSAAQ